MEGLLIAEELRRLEALLPSRRHAWRFPDPHTFVLPLEQGSSLWLFNRPPQPRFELLERTPPPGRSHTGFQDLLAAKAAGELRDVQQRKLDRVLTLKFAGTQGFVETAPVSLVAELTGRNCNLILLDEAGVVLGAAREVHGDVNRFRQVVAGRPYVPPPPYEKLDPRSASREELRQALRGETIRNLRKVVDGIGPQLSRVLARSAAVSDEVPLAGAELDRVLDEMEALTEGPSGLVRRALELPDAATLRRQERRLELTGGLRDRIGSELGLVEKRIADLERARSAAGEAQELRRQGDLLLAFGDRVPAGAGKVTLEDFSGESVTLLLDPAKSSVANAQTFFDRARKREARARQADAREPELHERKAELNEILASLEESSEGQLLVLLERFSPKERIQVKKGPGARYQGPHGLTVLVGRNARENDTITFEIARSRDIWLHAQGYHGSHVIIQSQNREVPFDTILFAAQLAAAYSKAADSENVPVDYTQRKNVWKVKGQSAGAVHFTRHKTVYVTPSRNPTQEIERGKGE